MQQIQKWGNSLGIRIPKALAVKAGLEEGTEVELDVEENHLVIKPRTKTLDELLTKVTPENIHSEVDTGHPQGNERW